LQFWVPKKKKKLQNRPLSFAIVTVLVPQGKKNWHVSSCGNGFFTIVSIISKINKRSCMQLWGRFWTHCCENYYTKIWLPFICCRDIYQIIPKSLS